MIVVKFIIKSSYRSCLIPYSPPKERQVKTGFIFSGTIYDPPGAEASSNVIHNTHGTHAKHTPTLTQNTVANPLTGIELRVRAHFIFHKHDKTNEL